MKRFAVFAPLSVCLLLASGCSDTGIRTYPVRGVVRFTDGKLLRQGSIEFESTGTEQAYLSRAEIQPDGSFVLGTLSRDDGAVAGKHRAVVISNSMIGNGVERPGLVAESPLHPKYATFRTSGLEFVVQEKPNNLVITVEYAPQDEGDKPGRSGTKTN